MSSFFILHIFENHLLPKTHLAPLPKINFVLMWPSVLLLICFGMMIFVKKTASSKVIKIIQAVFSGQNWQQLLREDYNPYKLYSIILAILFAVNFSFLLYKLNAAYNFVLINWPHYLQFLFIFSLITGSVLVKTMLNKAIMFFTGSKNALHQYSYFTFIVNQTTGILIFPLIVLAQFSKLNAFIFLSTAVVLITASIILKWVKGLVLSLLEERIGFLQTFAYFCALEILPVLVLVKFVIETF